MSERPRRRHAVTFPLFLIAAGVYLLAWNLGMTQWSPWDVATTFWPLLLVGLGLDLLLGRVSAWIAIPLAAVVLAALAVAVLGLVSHPEVDPWRGKLETTSVRVPLGDAASASVELDLVGGRLDLGATPAAGEDLVSGTTATLDRSPLIISQTRDGDDLDVTLRSRRGRGSVGPLIIGRPFGQQRWDLRLRPGLPLALDAETTAAEARLDLSDLDLRRLDLETELTDGTLVMPAVPALGAALKVTLGHLVVIVPDGVAARIRTDTRLATVRVDERRFPRRHGVYESEGFATAECRLTLSIDAALADVSVR